MIFLLGLVCLCVQVSTTKETISGFKYVELLARSCIYGLRALAAMILAMGHAYSMLLSVCVHGCVGGCVFNESEVSPGCRLGVYETHSIVLSKCHLSPPWFIIRSPAVRLVLV